jgi:hypothetical protein
MSDVAIMAPGYDVRRKRFVSPSHVRAQYAAHGVRQWSYCCFLCFGDSCLPANVEVEESGREQRAEILGKAVSRTARRYDVPSEGQAVVDVADAPPEKAMGRPARGKDGLRGDGQGSESDADGSVEFADPKVAVLPQPHSQLGSRWLLKYVSALWRLVLIAYTSVVTTALQFFSCREVAGQRLMRTQLAIECGTPEHTIASTAMAVVVAVCVVVLPVFLISVMFSELDGEKSLRRGKFKGISFWVGIVFQWCRLRLAAIPCLGPCCCESVRKTEGFRSYMVGRPIDGWYVIHPEEKEAAVRAVLDRGGDPRQEGLSSNNDTSFG